MRHNAEVQCIQQTLSIYVWHMMNMTMIDNDILKQKIITYWAYLIITPN